MQRIQSHIVQNHTREDLAGQSAWQGRIIAARTRRSGTWCWSARTFGDSL